MIQKIIFEQEPDNTILVDQIRESGNVRPLIVVIIRFVSDGTTYIGQVVKDGNNYFIQGSQPKTELTMWSTPENKEYTSIADLLKAYKKDFDNDRHKIEFYTVSTWNDLYNLLQGKV